VRAVLQRVASASVEVSGQTVARIGCGLVVLLGIEVGDSEEQARTLAGKTAALRIFPDAEGKMNRSLVEVDGEALVVSQFTLLAGVRKGRRPGFDRAAPPGEARQLVERFGEELEAAGVRVGKGVFGAHMVVELRNDGPVTILLDSAELERPRRPALSP